MKEFPVSPYSDKPVDADEEGFVDEDFNDEYPEVSADSYSFSASQPPVAATIIKSPSSLSSQKSTWAIAATLLGVVVVGSIVGSMLHSHKRNMSATAYLESMEVTSANAFADKESPQSKALDWIMHQDPMKLRSLDSEFIQRYVIATLVFSVVAPSDNDALLRDELYLLSDKHECDWQSKWTNRHDDSDELRMGIHCNEDLRVNQIIMPTLGLKGELPSELGSLEHLKKIVFDVNNLGGLIPYVPSLTSMSLAYNTLRGTLPEYLGLMTKLEELVLTENYFEGRLPDTIDSLTMLKRFAVGGNEFTGGIHSLFHLTELEEIYGAFNSLADGFDNESFGRLTNLRVLDLKNNKLEGPFPDILWMLPKLKVVDFHFNALDGHIHEIKDKFSPVLEYLDVSENFLGGGLPTTLNRVTDLVHLDVSSNRFEDPLPEDFSGLTKLTSLLLSDNSNFGPQPIPLWLDKLTNLRHLSLKLTGRTGTIPYWFSSSMKNLETLDMDWNRVSGTIPTDWANMTKLEHLILNRNWLEGTIPKGVSKLPNLKTIMLDNNNLVGELVSCQATSVVADCGDPRLGCPDCISETMEVNCPCCTKCCYDGDEYCNSEDWLSQIINDMKSDDPEIFYPSIYTPSNYKPADVFDPRDDDSSP